MKEKQTALSTLPPCGVTQIEILPTQLKQTLELDQATLVVLTFACLHPCAEDCFNLFVPS